MVFRILFCLSIFSQIPRALELGQSDISPSFAISNQVNRTNPLFGYVVGPGTSRMDKPILRPFSSDGCSQSPNSFFKTAIVECCVKHDVAYWIGGTYDQKVASDEALESCIAAKTNKAVGKVYRDGVSIGGGPLGNNTFRWGYGWDVLRPYGTLTADEIGQAERLYGKGAKELHEMVNQGRYKITFDLVTIDFDQINRFSDDIIVYYFLQNTLKRRDVVTYGQKLDVINGKFPYILRLKSCGDKAIRIQLHRTNLARDYFILRENVHYWPWERLKEYVLSVDDPGHCLD